MEATRTRFIRPICFAKAEKCGSTRSAFSTAIYYGPRAKGTRAMKIITNEAGRAHQMMVADEVRPTGGYYLTNMIRLISDRYGFSQSPSIEDIQTAAAVFRDGRLVSGTQKMNIQEIGVSSDGIYVTAQDTMTADFILDDLLTWAEQAVGLRPAITKIPRKYDNVAVVEFEADIEERLEIFNELISSYNEMLARLYNEAVSVSLYQIGFAFDSLEVNLAVNTNFIIERRMRVPFSSNRYFCIAPLKTEMHVELLEKFERALS